MNKAKHLTTVSDLLAVPLPEETDTYKPVSHGELMKLTKQVANDSGFHLKSESYLSNGKGTVATAFYDFNYGGDKEMGLRIAWQNSYNKAVTLKFAIGGNVFVCTNGMFHGDMGAFSRKHTGDVQVFTPEKIGEYFKTADETFNQLVQHKDDLKKIKIDRKVMSELVGDLYLNEQLLKHSQVLIIANEMENPSFDYQAENTAWEAYNTITHALKSVRPSEYLDSHQAVHAYFQKEFGLKSKFDQLELELPEDGTILVPTGDLTIITDENVITA